MARKKQNKIPQALKFEKTLMDDLKDLASAIDMTYNGLVEHILSTHVASMKKVIIKQKQANG